MSRAIVVLLPGGVLIGVFACAGREPQPSVAPRQAQEVTAPASTPAPKLVVIEDEAPEPAPPPPAPRTALSELLKQLADDVAALRSQPFANWHGLAKALRRYDEGLADLSLQIVTERDRIERMRKNIDLFFESVNAGRKKQAHKILKAIEEDLERDESSRTTRRRIAVAMNVPGSPRQSHEEKGTR